MQSNEFLERMNQQAIKTIDIENFWGKYHFHWELNPDVNILIGINGSGKSTVLKVVKDIFIRNSVSDYINDIKKHYLLGLSVKIDLSNQTWAILKGNDFSKLSLEDSNIRWEDTFFNNISSISTFDVPVTDREDLEDKDTFLDLELERVIYQRKGEVNNFTNYRLKITDPNLSEEDILRVNRRIKDFFGLINHFFEKTEKTIQIDSATNQLIFRTKDEKLIQLNQLSSGEKQLLIILFKVFLQDEKPYILLMDEPELSLHVYWQEKLIDTLRKLNPNCQLIIATHSGSIFSQGYEDKIFWMEDLMKAK